VSYACFECGERVPFLGRACENCGVPNPPQRHVRAALAPIMGALRWANGRNPPLPRLVGWIGALAVLGFFSPLIFSWWMIVGIWWLLGFMGSAYRVAILVGLPIAMAGVVLVQEAAGLDCEQMFPVCAAKALGLLGGTATIGGVVGVVLVALGGVVIVLAVRRAGRSTTNPGENP